MATTGASADWRAADVGTDADGGQHFTALTPDGPVPVRLQLPGSFNVANALVALACLAAVGVPAGLAAERFAEVAVPGRMQRVDVGQPFLAVVDYAHKPAAVAALLDTLRAQVPGRLIIVLGCGGDRDRGKRPLMGAAAAQRSDLLVVTDDNPRSEGPADIRAAMLAGALDEPGHGELHEIGDRRAAIVAAVDAARPGDAVVVAGKGHETGQEVAGVRHPFDDAVELAAAIRGVITACSGPPVDDRPSHDRMCTVIPLSLSEIAAVTNGRLHGARGTEVVTAVEFDSRAIRPGGLFLALPGERVDGHDFAAAAVERGAVGVLAAREVDGPAVVVPPVARGSRAPTSARPTPTAPAPRCSPRSPAWPRTWSASCPG